MDWDNRRTNVDSSKKLAVMQGMEYEQFRQMVLGANLKPMKKGQLERLYNQQNTESNFNHHASLIKIKADGTPEEGCGFDEEFVRQILKMEQTDLLEPPKTAEVFEKFLCKKLKTPMQRYTYMRLMEFDSLQSIFVQEVDPEVFLVIISTFLEQVIAQPDFNNAEEQAFVAKFILCLATQTPKFDFMLDFLGDDDRDQVKTLIKGLSLITDDQRGLLLKHFEAFVAE